MMASTLLSRKEQLWLSCKEKRCCTYYTVTLTGLDIWRISRAMQLPPSVFTLYIDASPDAEDGFALDSSGRRYQVILAKCPEEGQELSRCVFLWRLPDGSAHCGLGDLRPTVCRAYPSIMVAGIHCIGECDGCSCVAWSLAHVDAQDEMPLVRSLEHERVEYREIVQQWNARIEQAERQQYGYVEFCNYLMNTYAACYEQ